MALAVTMSRKNQIVVPGEARKKLHLKAGAKLLVMCRDDRIVLIPKPDDFAENMKGLHKEIWEGLEAKDYLSKERESW